MERRLAAMFAADVVGHSRFMGLDELGTLAARGHEPLNCHSRDRVTPCGLLDDASRHVPPVIRSKMHLEFMASWHGENQEHPHRPFRVSERGTPLL